MSQWVYRGLREKVPTTRYPVRAETAPGAAPGLPEGGAYPAAQAAALAGVCPTQAITAGAAGVTVDYHRCVHCFRCTRETPAPIRWHEGYACAGGTPIRPETFARPFQHSLHILVFDAGDCGACLHEVKQLNNPYYNMHRLGFFLTPTPRHADVLLIVGPGVDHLRHALEKTYRAMPEPKRVVAVGACALAGGMFGPSFMTGRGVADILPVDVEVPGHPPPPLAILHGLLVATGRARPAALSSPADEPTNGKAGASG